MVFNGFFSIGNSDHVVSVSIGFLLLIGIVFVIIGEMFCGRISLNLVLQLLVVNF